VLVFAVVAIVSLIAGLIALRWRINLQRHKYDLAATLLDKAFAGGGAKEAVAISKALETVLKSTGSEPRFERSSLQVSVPRRRAFPAGGKLLSIDGAAKGDGGVAAS
jgi:hypothetical protein